MLVPWHGGRTTEALRRGTNICCFGAVRHTLLHWERASTAQGTGPTAKGRTDFTEDAYR